RRPAPTASWFPRTSSRARSAMSSTRSSASEARGVQSRKRQDRKPIVKILVANLGSTSFKYRLFDMTDERVLARGGVERIGSEQSCSFLEAAGVRDEATVTAKDHAVDVELCLRQLVE